MMWITYRGTLIRLPQNLVVWGSVFVLFINCLAFIEGLKFFEFLFVQFLFVVIAYSVLEGLRDDALSVPTKSGRKRR